MPPRRSFVVVAANSKATTELPFYSTNLDGKLPVRKWTKVVVPLIRTVFGCEATRIRTFTTTNLDDKYEFSVPNSGILLVSVVDGGLVVAVDNR